MSVYSFGVELFQRYPLLFIGNVMLALVLMVVDAATLVSIAPVVGLLTQADSVGRILPIVTSVLNYIGIEPSIEVFLSIFVTFTILNSLMLIAINYYILKAQFVVRRDMVMGTAKSLFFTSMSFHNQQRQGDFINTLTHEVSRVGDAFTATTRLIAPVAQVGVLLSIPFYISWEVTSISLASALALTIPLRFFHKRIYVFGQGETRCSNRFYAALQEGLSNVRVTSAFANEKTTLWNLESSFSKLRDMAVKSQILSTTIHSLFAPIGIIVVFITFVVGRKFGVPLAETSVILYAFNRLAGSLGIINTNIMQLISHYPSYEQVIKVREDATAASLVFGDQPFRGIENSIRLEDVSFSYSSDAAVLKHIDLSIPVGKMTAFVGVSGAGKSTLADLILGMQQPTEGRIMVDDRLMNDLDIFSYRKALGYVPQNSELLHASIRENITWAKVDASEAELLDACQSANAVEFIEGLEDGLETIVGDRGLKLSGGQVQRIALARALVRNPKILVLDEATSALDSQSEKLIQSSIEGIMGTTTIIVIAHRLSTIVKADNIVVLDQGRIIENGTYEELMENEGAFANLVELQKL